MVSVKILKEAIIFKNLNDAQLDKLAGMAVSETHRAGTVLFKEGDIATHFYIIEEGKIALRTTVDVGPVHPAMQFTITTITRGAAMGWSAFAEPHKYTLSGLCMEDSRLVSFEADKLRELVHQDHALGIEVMNGIVQLLASRLKNIRVLMFAERAAAQIEEMETPGM
jgi:CRP/FNR family cyclic AMP-dependent transcriptional regulator